MFNRYMEWISIWINRVKIGETYKKVMVMILVISLVIVSLSIRYIFVLSVRVYGMSSVIALGVYG